MCRDTSILFAVLAFLVLGFAPASAQSPDSLSLESAAAAALKNNPELKILRQEMRALEAQKLQAGLHPNPEIEIEVEDILGTKDFAAFTGSELSAKVSQSVALSSKYKKAEDLAATKISLAEWDYLQARRELITAVRKAFAQCALADELITSKKELIERSNAFTENLKRRVEAGRISSAEVTRAKLLTDALHLDVQKLEADYRASLLELQMLMNTPALPAPPASYPPPPEFEVPPLDELAAGLEQHPLLRRYEQEFAAGDAAIAWQEALAVPDMEVSAGFKRVTELEAHSFMLGAAIPLPFFDKNQGAIEEAYLRRDQKETEMAVMRSRLTLRMQSLHNRLQSLAGLSNRLREESLADAEETLEIITEGNQAGRYTIIDVLDAERTYYELRHQYLEMLGEMQLVQIELEGLTKKELIEGAEHE